MANIQAQIKALNSQYNALSLREKWLIILSGLVLIVMVSFSYVLEPAWQKTAQFKKDIGNLEQEYQSLITEQGIYQEHLNQDLNTPLAQQQKALNQVIGELDGNLDHSVVNLVAPQTMPAVIQGILEQMDGVEIISFAAETPRALMGDTQNDESLRLFRHEVSIKMRGNYRQLYEILAKVEELPWQFYWHNFQYQVVSYPKAELSVSIYTLSLKEGFIGL